MSIDPTIARRTALVAGLAGVGTVALAACGSDSSGSNDTRGAVSNNPPTAADTTEATSSAAAPSSEDSSKSSSDDSGSGGGSGAQAIVSLDDIKVGESVDAKIGDKSVLVSRPTETTAVCFSAICTHEGCTVKAAGAELDCPCHGSKFDAKTGAVLGGPAPSPLEKIAVKVSGGKVVAG